MTYLHLNKIGLVYAVGIFKNDGLDAGIGIQEEMAGQRNLTKTENSESVLEN